MDLRKSMPPREFDKTKAKDVIYNTSTMQFGFWDRVKILYGKKVITNLQIYCEVPDACVIGTEAKTFVQDLFPGRTQWSKGGGEELPTTNQEAL